MGFAFSIITPVILGGLIGQQLDTGNDFPIWTICLSTLGMAVGFWSVYKNS